MIPANSYTRERFLIMKEYNDDGLPPEELAELEALQKAHGEELNRRHPIFRLALDEEIARLKREGKWKE